MLGSTARAFADVLKPYSFDLMPPMDGREAFIDWAVKNRGEDPKYLGERFDRFKGLVSNKDVWDKRNERAFLLTPREEFVLKRL
jgi:protein-L-isoaspartate(D-aspartate) O-methyltransferase